MKFELFSFFVYIITFVLSIIFFRLSEFPKLKKISGLFAFGGLLSISLLAGLRADSVGRDVKNYILNLFTPIDQSDTLMQAFNLLRAMEIESVHIIIFYISSRIFKGVGIKLFLLQFLTVCPVYLSAKIWQKKYGTPTWLFMLCYLFIFFNHSLNNMRQSVAAALLLLAYSMYIDEKKRKCLIPLVLSFFSHKSAFIGVILISLGHWISDKGNKVKTIVFLILLSFPTIIIPISNLLIKYISIPQSIEYYLNVFVFQTIKKDWVADSLSIYMYFEIISRGIFLIIFMFIRKKCSSMYKIKYIVVLGTIIYIIVCLMYKTTYGVRITWFTDFFELPLLSTFAVKSFKPKKYGVILVILVTFFYWMLIVFVADAGNTSVYRFR